MNVTTYTSANEFLDVVGDWLEKAEVVNGLMLGLADRLACAETPVEPAPVMMAVSSGTELQAATLMTPPRGVILYAPATEPHDALDGLATALITGRHRVPECIGPSATADLFATIWSGRTGHEVVRSMAMRIYGLRRVRMPRGVSGSPRSPRTEDVDLVASLTRGFTIAVGEPSPPEGFRSAAERAVADGQLLLWEHQGRPVSMAAAVRPTRHGIGIGRVYTPPEHRGNGFASACVAHLSQRQLDAGRQFCCLYTDLANPTSNSIYQRIGYVPVADSSHYWFSAATEEAGE